VKQPTRFLLTVVVALLAASAARAQSVADFYKGKTVFLQIGSGPGGVYDIMGRMVARHIGQYIPGEPKVIPQNVPGGGSLQLANQFAAIAARDGTVFGVFNNGMSTTPLLDPGAGRFDPRKFNFLGSPSREAHILVVWRDAPAKTFEDLFNQEVILGATSPGAAPLDFPLLTNALIGTKFKIIMGYPGGPETLLAMRRGEIHGNGGLALGSYKTDYQDAARAKDVRILAAFGMRQHPELKDVPMFPTGKTPEERQLFELMYARQDYGRPFATPEGVPKERVQALRDAFQKTMRDPAFLAEASRANADIDPVAGEELEALTTRLYQTSPDTVARMQKIMNATK
jgi:tripartite-type tricarboxylate transporter receptor subunit TctC